MCVQGMRHCHETDRKARSHGRSRHLFQPKICLSLCKAVGSPSLGHGHGDLRWVVQILNAHDRVDDHQKWNLKIRIMILSETL